MIERRKNTIQHDEDKVGYVFVLIAFLMLIGFVYVVIA